MHKSIKSDKQEEIRAIEVVTDVKPDSIFSTKYVVRIKRIEVVENDYYLHTNKELKTGIILVN